MGAWGGADDMWTDLGIGRVSARLRGGSPLDRIVLSTIFFLVAAVGVLASPSAARADCAVTTAGSPLTFTSLNQTVTLNSAAVQNCDQYIEDNSSWGGFFTTNGGDAYNYFGLGVSPYNGAPQAQQITTSKATYEFSGDLTTDTFTVRLVSLSAGATLTDTITLYMCAAPEVPANANGCPTTSVTTIAVGLDLAPPVITTTSLAGVTAGSAYNQTLVATGDFLPKTFSLQSGALPPGVTLSGAGALSGTPTSSGTFTFTALVTDSASQTDDQALSITVAAPVLTLTPTTLPNPVISTSYTQAVSAADGIAPYTYVVTAGALPPGLSLSSAGDLTGTPTAAGSFPFTITATDSTGVTAGTGSQTYTFTIAPPVLTLTPASLSNPVIGQSFTQALSTSGGTAPYAYNVTGTLPPGITLSGASLSGAPTSTGSYSFTVSVTDSTGGTAGSASQAYAVTIAAPTITVSPGTLTDVVRGGTAATTFTASGGTAPYAFSVTGSLPSGVTLSPAGELAGTIGSSGVFNFTVTAQDSTGGGTYSGSQAITWTVTGPVISLSTLPGGTTYSAYSTTITAFGGSSPYSFQTTGGVLPAGLTLSSGGVLSGTPTQPGAYTFTVRATDSSADGGPYSGDQSYTVVIAAPTVSLPATTLPNGTITVAYNAVLTPATGGLANYTYTVTGGALPAGLSLSSAGVISGTPTAGGTFTFQVTATDSSGAPGPYTGVQTYQLTVSSQPPVVVPTMTEWAMMLLAALIAGCGALVLNRRRTA